MFEIESIRATIEASKSRSCWDKGVKLYALELLAELEGEVNSGWIDTEDLDSKKLLHRALLNGASDWREYSEGGLSLIYDRAIAERLCTKSEFKRTKGGALNPNSCETWIEVQARALYQAEQIILSAARKQA